MKYYLKLIVTDSANKTSLHCLMMKESRLISQFAQENKKVLVTYEKCTKEKYNLMFEI